MTSSVLYIFVLLIAALGACLGSFLNVVIWRVPEKMSLIAPPSHCPKCGSPVRWFDNIPVLSWFILRAKCRDCKEPISGRYPFVESLSAGLALVLAAAFLLGGWTGGKSQWFYWGKYAEYVSSWGDALGVPFFSGKRDATEIVDSKTSELNRELIQEGNAPYVVDMFLRALLATTFLAIMFTVAIDMVLVLGFVEFDRGSTPHSLVFASILASIIAVALVVFLSGEDSEPSCFERVLAAVKSAFFGFAGSLVFFKWTPPKERLGTSVIGVCGGLWLPSVWAFVVAGLAGLLALILRNRTRRSYFGLLFFFFVFGSLAVETIKSFLI